MPQSSFSPLMRITALAVIITFTMLILEPTAVAAKVLHDEHLETVAEAAREEAAKLTQTLQTVETTLTELQTELANDTRSAKLNLGQTQKMFKGLKKQVLNLDEQVQIDFEAVESHIKDKKLPNEILQRHQNAVTTYRQHLATLLANLEDILVVKNKGQLHDKADKALKHLKPLQKQGKHPHFDPNNLPFNVPDGKKVRSPKEDEKELKKLFPAEAEPVKVAATTLLPEMLTVAAAPDATYLQPTVDVQITPEIEALALELEHKPVAIYNWVHDNIQFIPTYGSIQGSQLTLENKAGNATDTASLLIALLRASGIHARYVYGTVQIPMAKVMNWVGGVTSPEAAIQILGQGGIPISGVVQGGQIAFIKMEHVWVDAYVDYRPSRGARHRKGDSWIPMDASFKQYQFTEGMDIQSNVSFDAEGFVEQLTQNAQINEQEGWVSGIDQTFIQTTLENYQTQIANHIEQANPEATVGEVIGTQTIIPSKRPTLAAGLPYKLIAKGNKFKILPANLRHQFKFSLYAQEMDRILDNPALTLTESLPNLAGKRLTLSFEPATVSDRQVIESYLPEVLEGQELDLNDLPTSLPGYLIRLKAQLKLDGEIVAESGSFTMGQELSSTTGITRMTSGWYSANNKPIAGEFYAFGIDLQGISATQLEAVKTRMETVKTQLETQQFEGLTKDDLIGEMLYAGALSYFAANDVNLKMLNKGKQALSYRLPSFGTFSTSLDTVYSFGVPRQVKMSGIMVDMDAVAQSLWTKDNDAQMVKTLVQQVGMIASALEHQIPEMLFTNEENPGEGVSAVKALALASAQGQRIYQVTEENVNVVLPVLNISTDVKDEISASVAVGKVATVSQNNITVGGWTGVGYIIADPETGAGAYRISGGYNGCTYEDGFWTGFGIVGLVASFLFMSSFTPLLAFLFILMIAFSVEQLELNLNKRDGKGGTVGDFWIGLLCGFGFGMSFLAAMFILREMRTGGKLALQTAGFWEVYELLYYATAMNNITPCTDDYNNAS